MSEPIALTLIQQPSIGRMPLTTGQVADLVELMQATNFYTIPEGKNPSDIVRFGINILANGAGMLDVAFK